MRGHPPRGPRPPRTHPEPPVIKFRCVQCQKKIGVADAAAGKRAKCPTCSAVMRVPQPEAEPVVAAHAEPEFRLAEDPVEPRRERRRRPSSARSSSRGGGGGDVADHTVAGQVLSAPSAGGFEPEAQLERRAREDAMDSLAGLAALEEQDADRLMSFGSSMGPAPRPKARKRRQSSGRKPAAIRPACGTCGAETPASARFCTSCGAALGAPVLPADAADKPIPLPPAAPARKSWKDGFFGWLLGAR